MTTADYRDLVSSLSNAIGDFQACVGFEERVSGAKRLMAWWERLARIEQPKRLPQRDADRCQRIMARAAEMLNNWKVDVDSGVAQEKKPIEPPAKAMADTMRFCAAAKRHGF